MYEPATSDTGRRTSVADRSQLAEDAPKATGGADEIIERGAPPTGPQAAIVAQLHEDGGRFAATAGGSAVPSDREPSTTNPYCSYPDRVTGTTTC